MGKVFFDLGMTLDGFVAGPNGSAKVPLGEGGRTIHDWMFKQKAFLSRVGIEGGENGEDGEIINGIFNRIGANIMGKKMFIEGEANWPEEAPFRKPVFVLTNEKREPWVRPGGTTFYFVNDGIESALKQAKEAAGDMDVRISGGADTVQQFINAGYIDEFTIHLAPLLLGSGRKLFENIDKNFSFVLEKSLSSPLVTHLYYKVKK